MNKKALVLRFTLLEIFYWCSVGAFSSFVAAYLQSERGISDGTVGIMLMLMTAGAFAGQFFWGRLCDKFRTHKKVFLLTCAMQAPLCFLMFFVDSVPALYVLYALLGFVQSTMPANMDTWLMRSFPDDPLQYGPIRSGAALVYAVFTLAYGNVLQKTGYQTMLFCVSVFILLAVGTALATPDISERDEPAVREKSRGRLMTPAFVVLLFVLLCAGVSGSVFQYFTILVNNVNGSVFALGACMFASAMTEVPFMFFSRKFGGWPVRARVLLGCACYFLTVLLYAFARTSVQVVLISCFSGAGFGILMPAMREWVYECSNPSNRTTAQGVADAVYTSLAGIISTGAVGLFTDTVSLRPVMLSFAVVQLIGIVPLALSLMRRGKTAVNG